MTPVGRQGSVLLATGSAGGTIAAVRSLGTQGFDVGVLSSRPFSAAAWSRGAARRYAAPDESRSDEFLSRLLEVGRAQPGQILLPTSDETAWLYTKHAAVLAECFRLSQPSLSTLQRILDKKLLADAAASAGVSIPPLWDPRDDAELMALAPRLPYPVLIKPRTHVHRLLRDKGVVVRSAQELIEQYQRVRLREQSRLVDDPLMPDARRPLLQQFVNVAAEGVLSITGFLDRTGELYVTRRSTKVFLRSYPVGVGICYEALPADPVLSAQVRRLCTALGYHGMFEVEFLKVDGDWAMIDFNPRLFNQLGMDIHRGMPLPLLACLEAAGDTDALRHAVAKANAVDQRASMVFCDRFTLRLILLVRRLTAGMSRSEISYWRRWVRQNASHSVDVAADENDRVPRLIHALSEMWLGLQALPKFLRVTRRVSALPSRAGKSA